MPHGNNTSINEFWLSGNPDLYCIEVDNVIYAEDHWSGDPKSLLARIAITIAPHLLLESMSSQAQKTSSKYLI